MKKMAIIILTVILSILYIFVSNKIVTKNNILDGLLNEFTTYNAKVLSIDNTTEEEYDIGSYVDNGKLIEFSAKITSGDLKGEVVKVTQLISPFFAIQPDEVQVGNKVLITESIESNYEAYTMIEYVRFDTIVYLVLIFAICLLIFGKNKGVLTLASLILTCSVIFLVFIPAIINGFNIYFWSIQICIFIIIMTLILVNGVNFKSISAILGCLGGVLTTGIITLIADLFLKLTGLVSDESVYVQMINPDKTIDLKAIIFAAIIIGAIGAVMDVSISIASSLNELYEQNPQVKFISLYKSGITIGKDIMGTMTNTLILAYIGSSLSTVLLLIANTSSILYLLNREMIIVELLQAVVGSLGILLTLPLTAFISAFLYTRKIRLNKE